MVRPLWVASLLTRFGSATGISRPLGALAAVVAVALLTCTGLVVLLDRARSFEQAELAGRHVAELARQRTGDLLQRLDTGLRQAAEATAGIDAGTATGQARLDAILAQRRRSESRVLGLYLVGRGGAVTAGSSATSFGIGALVPACLRDQRVEVDQLALKRLSADLSGEGGGIVCALRGTSGATDSGVGAIVAILAPELFQTQYADLAVGAHGLITLFDENGRMLAQVAAGGMPVVGKEPLQPMVIGGRTGGAAAADGGIVETRRVDGPVAAVVAISLLRADILQDWWYRTLLLSGSGLIVVAFVGLALLAARRGESLQLSRLERLAELPGMLEGNTDPQRLAELLARCANALVACDAAIAATGPADNGFDLTLMRLDRVRIGPITLTRRGGGGFSPADLACLRVLARLAGSALHQATDSAALQAEAMRLQHEMEHSNQERDSILQEISDASFSLDADWCLVASNRNADRLFGEYPEDLRGRSLWEAFPELVGSTFETECRRALREGHQAVFDLQWIRSDNWVTIRAFPRPPGLVIYVQDISARMVADDRLRQVAKMDAIGRLTGGIAHDFNNLLTVVLGNIEMLDMELPETGEIREMHDQIRRAAQSAAELTHQLLAFARRQPLSPADVDVGRLIGGLDGLLRRDLGAGVALQINAPDTLWHARVDPTQLEAAVLNLASNAREAMPLGGRLTIAAANLAIRKPDIDQFGEIRPGNYVMVSVADTGGGIAKELLGQVFDPFFSTKPPGRGTGLGLSMVYGFATQSGGHARISSEPGRGTMVRLYLPSTIAIVDEAAEPLPGAPVRRIRQRALGGEAAMPGGGEWVLIVEDSDMVRDYARNVLAGLGYEVTTAADGPEALSLLDGGLRPDLLLTDVLLPNGMNGLELADHAAERLPGMPVLFMSGYIENVDRQQSRLDPGTNLLLKPFRRASLASMVRARLDRPQAA